MKILFYAPFKPLGHANPSGDAVTAAGIFKYLTRQGHEVLPTSTLRSRWIYWKPWLWPQVLWERQRISRQLASDNIDIWFTYHTYYKAPDLLGAAVARKLGIPYVIFQGIYSTKRMRRLKTCIGFYLNKNTLCVADHVFANKSVDMLNLKRLLPENRLTYVAPGIVPNEFRFDEHARDELRKEWNVGDAPVMFSAAMFRADVKTEGLMWVIRACVELDRQGQQFHLVIAGDGKEKNKLQKMADEHISGRVRFVGRIPRKDMYRFYSAADLFVFPGIQESLGMVFLEAQACGLPVIAFDNAGVPEAVQNGKTGILVPMYAMGPFVDAIKQLLNDEKLRRQMGHDGKTYVREAHDIGKNYQKLESVIRKIISGRRANSPDDSSESLF